MRFTATSNTATISFSGVGLCSSNGGNGGDYLGVDNVSLREGLLEP